MRRYWVPDDALVEGPGGQEIVLAGDVLHHVRDVCRMRKGSRFEVILSGGRAYLVEIVNETKNLSMAKIIEARQIEPLPTPHLHLVIAVPRLPVFEAVLEKAVELGVHAVHPVVSDFSFIKTQTDIFDKKRTRFEKIVQSATQQSGRGDLMPIGEPTGLEEVLQTFNQSGTSAGLFAYEGEAVLTAKEGIQKVQSGNPQQIWIFVGAEGGFSEREVQLFRSHGLESVTLGPQVLRVETACLALVSIIKYGFDLMR